MIKAEDVIRILSESAPTPDQQKIEKTVTDIIISSINEIVGKDRWQYKFINDYKHNYSNAVSGMIIRIRRIPPSTVPNLFEQFDFNFDFDFKDKCIMLYQYGRDLGEINKKEFKTDLSKLKQDLVKYGKQIYFDSGNVPYLDRVIDVTKLH